MESNNSKKLTLIRLIIILFAIILILGCVALGVYKSQETKQAAENKPVVENTVPEPIVKPEENIVEENTTVESKNEVAVEPVEPTEPVEDVTIDDWVYHQRMSSKSWSGEYHSDVFYTESSIEIGEVVSYDDYVKYIDKVNNIVMNNAKIEKYYTDRNSNYIILAYASGISRCQMDIVDCIEHDGMVTNYGDEVNEGEMSSGSGYFVVIPTKLPAGEDTDIEYIECYSELEINTLKNAAKQ